MPARICSSAAANRPRSHRVGQAAWCACSRTSGSSSSPAIRNSSPEISSALANWPRATWNSHEPTSGGARSAEPSSRRATVLARSNASPDLRRRPAVHAHQRGTELGQDRELGAVAFRRSPAAAEQRQGAAEVLDRLAVGRAAHRLLAGLAPVGDRLLGQAGAGAVVRQQLGLASASCGNAALDRGDEPAVQDLPAAAEQALVGGVPDERVLEAVDGGRRLAAPDDEAARLQRPQRRVKLRPRQVREAARSA